MSNPSSRKTIQHLREPKKLPPGSPLGLLVPLPGMGHVAPPSETMSSVQGQLQVGRFRPLFFQCPQCPFSPCPRLYVPSISLSSEPFEAQAEGWSPSWAPIGYSEPVTKEDRYLTKLKSQTHPSCGHPRPDPWAVTSPLSLGFPIWNRGARGQFYTECTHSGENWEWGWGRVSRLGPTWESQWPILER